MSFENIEYVDIKYLTILLLPILIIISPSNSAEIPVIHRMSQFDSLGVQYGCRFSNLNLEIKSLDTWSTSRHCVLTRMEDLTVASYSNIIKKSGGLIIQLPKNFANLSADTKNEIYEIEGIMLNSLINIPVYFSPYNAVLENIITDIHKMGSGNTLKKQSSALSDLLSLVSSNGYQAISSGSSHTPNKNVKLSIIKGELLPVHKTKTSDQSKLSTIVITANISPFRVTNHVSFNPDAALMTLIMDPLNKLYNSKHTAPDFKIMFLLSESGPLLNFQGTKKWLEDNQIQDVDFVLCLDTIVQPTLLENKRNIYMHVSKPPKDGSATNKFYKLFKETGEFYNVTIEGIHKKINLAEQQMPWEHERFGMKKITSFTLSNVKNYKSIARNTIFIDDNELINSFNLNSQIVIETLIKYIFEIDNNKFSSNILATPSKSIGTWKDIKSTMQTNDMKNAFEKYLQNVKTTYDKPDNRDPDFMLYNGPEAQLNIYKVKPAVFDLLLTIVIVSYLSTFYLALNYFPKFYEILIYGFASKCN